MKIYIVLGFLGSGKTTFLKKMLNDLVSFSKVAVIINEFGNVSIDSQELKRKEVELKEITGGSVFCACKYDKFVSMLMELHSRDIDAIVVESSGFSNPTSLHKIINELKESGYDFDPYYISVIDSVKFLKLRKTLVLIDNQIKYSNLILINKIDLVEKDELLCIEETVRGINPYAAMLQTVNCDIEINKILKSLRSNDFSYVDRKNVDFSSLGLKLKENLELSLAEKLLNKISDRIFRAKGYVKSTDGLYLLEVSSGIVTRHQRESGQGDFVILYSTEIIGKKEIIEVLSEIIE